MNTIRIQTETPSRVIIDSRTLLKCVCIPLTFTIIVLNIVYLDQRQPVPNLSQLAVLKTANDSVRETLLSAKKSSERTHVITDFNLLRKIANKHDEDTAIEWLMRERRQILRQTCHTFDDPPQPGDDRFQPPNFIPIDALNALFLPVPKVGCTNWKKIIMMIEGDAPKNLSSPSQIKGDIATEYGKRKTREFIAQYDRNQSIAKTRQKFIVVREPFQRLLSAYRNKIEPAGRLDLFGQMSRYISTKYRTNQTDKTERAATFDEFLSFYVNPEEKTNEHWTSFYQLAKPCQFQYDFILKLEDIEFESNWLFRHLQIDLSYPQGYKRPTDKHTRTEAYLQNIDKKLLHKVYDLLRLDYQLFNYPLPSFLDVS